jgi:hypothetical protein
MSTQEWSSKVYKSITNFHFFFMLLLLLVGEGNSFWDMHKSFVFFPIESRVFALHFIPDSICCRCNRACAQVDLVVAAGGHTHLSTTNAKNDVCLYFDSGKKVQYGNVFRRISKRIGTSLEAINAVMASQ